MTGQQDHQPEPDVDELVARLLAARGEDIDGDPDLARVRELAARLDELGRTERALRDAALDPSRGASDPRLTALEGQVEQLVTQRLAQRRTHWFGVPRWTVGLAAALCVAAALWFVFDGLGRPPELRPGEAYHLGEGATGTLTLRPIAGDSIEFSWPASNRRDAVYEVAVYDRDPARGGVVIARGESLDEPRWDPAGDATPTARPVREWPTTVWIEVRVDSPSGGNRTVVSGPLSR